MSGLTTHILDLTHGQPARNVLVELYRIHPASHDKVFITSAKTNLDGRMNKSLLEGEQLQSGTYEMIFHIGDYFKNLNVELTTPSFLDLIPVRFHLSDVSSHYHVPLLVSPWGYQIYRGS